MDAAKVKAKEEQDAIDQASKLKKKAVFIAQNAASLVEEAKKQLESAQKAKVQVEEHVKKQTDILSQVIKQVSDLTTGTQTGSEDTKKKVEEQANAKK